MLLSIDPFEPEHWLVSEAVKVVRKGGVIAIPTDTVYGVACDVESDAGVERIYRMKDMGPKKLLSIICADLTMAAAYTQGIPNTLFRIVRRLLPGPYTFILPASKELPRSMRKHRKTVGIRIPDCPITLELVRQHGRPLISTSIRSTDTQWINDPFVIEEHFRSELDLVVDGGPLLAEPSTVIDFTGLDPVLVREGKGPVDFL